MPKSSSKTRPAPAAPPQAVVEYQLALFVDGDEEECIALTAAEYYSLKTYLTSLREAGLTKNARKGEAN